MVQPLSDEASGKQYQTVARAAINGVGNREETGLLESQYQRRAWISGHGYPAKAGEHSVTAGISQERKRD